MGQVTVRPDETVASGEFSPTGEATIHEAVDDDPADDATYAANADAQVNMQSEAAVVGFPTPTIPPGAVIAHVAPRMRVRSNDGDTEDDNAGWLTRLEHDGDWVEDSYLDEGDTTTVEEVTGASRTVKPSGGPWAAADVAATVLRIGLQDFTPGSVNGGRFTEVYLDVTYNERPVGTLTAPTGTYTDTSAPDAEWDYSDPEDDPQTAFRLVVETGDHTTESEPGAGTEVYDSGKVSSSAKTATLPALESGTYTVWLQVWHANVSTQTVSSAWDSSAYTLDITPPAVPAVTATAEDPDGRVAVTADSDSPAGEEAEDYDVQYSDDGGTTWADVRDGTKAAPDSGVDDTVATVHDYESPPNTLRHYRARAGRYDVTTGDRVVSDWSDGTAAAAVTVDRWWLKDPRDPDVNMHLSVVDYRQAGDRITLDIQLLDDQTWDDWQAIFAKRRTLLLQTDGTVQWYVRLVGDRAAVHHPIGRDFAVVVDDGTDPHPPAHLAKGTSRRTSRVTAVLQEAP